MPEQGIQQPPDGQPAVAEQPDPVDVNRAQHFLDRLRGEIADAENNPDDGVRRVVVHDPVVALSVTVDRLLQLADEMRLPRPDVLIDNCRAGRQQIAGKIEAIVKAVGEVWPTAGRFADVVIVRDEQQGRFDLKLNGLQFPFALDADEPLVVRQRFGTVSTVTLPVLARTVTVNDVTVGGEPSPGRLPDVVLDTADDRDEQADPNVEPRSSAIGNDSDNEG